jgi:glycosyltransferase involved in cell wall biosynthesis
MLPDAPLTVVMPVFNEESTIAQSIDRVLEQDFVNSVVVVNDGSSDRTKNILDAISDARVTVIHHHVNKGKGAALRTGFGQATGPYVAIQDADLEYDPKDLRKLLQPLEEGEADVVYGSRFLTGEARRVLFFWHSMGNQALTMLSNAATNLNLSDMETCYKVFRKSVLDRIVIEEDRFGFEPEITIKIAALGVRIYEVGISYHGRGYEEGKKIGWRDGLHAVVCIGRYSVQEQRVKSRRRKLAAARPPSLHASLESLETADNYYTWIWESIESYVGTNVLEIGAGSGTFTAKTLGQGRKITAIEPDPAICKLLENRFRSDEDVTVFHGTLEDYPPEQARLFDTVIMVNVLEHIDDERQLLESIKRISAPGANIIIWVPALEVLYTPFDRAVGHFRRYSKKRLRALCQTAHLDTLELKYFNLPGAFAWFLVAGLARRQPTEGSLTRIYDKWAIPRLENFERGRDMPFGQSLLLIARTPETSG